MRGATMQAFPIVIYKDTESDYGTEVPDLQGCYSAGSTISEALEQTREAIYAHLEGMAKDGEVVPKASDLSAIQGSGDHADALAFAVVEIDLNKVSTATERINVTLPKWLISSIDASEPNRSRFLAQSAIRALQDRRGKYVV